MSFLGISGFNFQSLASLGVQAGLAFASGGTSVVAQTIAKQLVSAIAQQVLQNIGQKLGLPQAVIDGAQAAFSAASGNPAGVRQNVNQIIDGVTRQFNLSPAQQGELRRAADQSELAIEAAVQQAVRRTGLDAKRGAEREKAAARPGNYLEALALALGKALDDNFDKALDLANQIAEQTAANNKFVSNLGDKPSQGDTLRANDNQSKLGTTNSLFQAVNQQISILQSVIKTAFDAIGGAQSTIARRN